MNGNYLLIKYFKKLLKNCLFFPMKWRGFRMMVFLNACVLFSLSFCLFSQFQSGGHGCVLLSMPRLLVEYSSTWIIFGFWSAIHRQRNNYACRIIFRVINNNKNHNITYEHLLHTRQYSKHFVSVISINPVDSLMREKNYYLHFTDKNIKAQKGGPTCPISQMCRWAKSQSAWLQG